ncbi:MAG: sialate O-acetylesterase, partial [Phycisphaerae bacterium]|nr:sialate O-acetylesterase [Phycisphaerae bacterium]
MDRIRDLFVVALLVLPASAAQVLGDVKMPAVFANHMVLQRGMPVPVWGWAEAGEKVSVSFGQQAQTTTAAADGKWMVKLAPLTVGPARTLSISGKNRIDLTDVLVGEVWICSGQSNMAWTVASALDSDLETAAAGYPQIRLFKVQQHSTPKAQTDVTGQWSRCSAQTV